MNDVCAIILAAGDGKRMKSSYPKVLCEVLFKPMIQWIFDLMQESDIPNICTVVGNGAEHITKLLPQNSESVLQTQRKGTGHAVMMTQEFLLRHRQSDIVVLCGDAPFMDKETLTESLLQHRSQNCAMTIVTAQVDDPTGYGRIIRDGECVRGIVEQADATDCQKQICEINSGTYWFKGEFLLSALSRLDEGNAQGEYYLTDTAAIAVKDGLSVGAYMAQNPRIVLGANDRKGLLRLNEIAKKMVFDRLLLEGVNLVSTDGVIISPDVTIGQDSTIYPGTILKGKTVIGAGCTIGPNTLIENSTIGDGSVVNASQVYQSTVGKNVRIGPFSHLRPNSHLEDSVKVGNFVEVKNSTVGEKTSIAHLTYIGDSDLGRDINVGCGCVTVNYDGINKYRTTIEDGAFIGCNTNLIAPVTVKKGSITAAGSTITEDTPENSLAIARARQQNKEGWATKFRETTKKIPR